MKRKVLIVGNGLIGRSLSTIESFEFEFFVTQRKKPESPLFLDLETAPSSWTVNFSDFEYLVIAAGLSGEDKCKIDLVKSSSVNVKGIFALIKIAQKAGCFVIHFSTTFLYSFEPTSDEYMLKFPYTYQKWHIENSGIDWSNNCANLRISKVLQPHKNLDIVLGLQKNSNGKLSLFDDYFFSPISNSFLCKVVLEIIRLGIAGNYTISSYDSISYFHFSLKWCEKTKVDPKILVKVHSQSELRESSEMFSHSQQSLRRLGMTPPSVMNTIDSLIFESQKMIL